LIDGCDAASNCWAHTEQRFTPSDSTKWGGRTALAIKIGCKNKAAAMSWATFVEVGAAIHRFAKLRVGLKECQEEIDSSRVDSLAHDAPRILVLSHSQVPDVTDMVRVGPFKEFEIGNEVGLHPGALFHLRRGEPFTPSAGSPLGEILERTRVG
jgi:hypothetical protein